MGLYAFVYSFVNGAHKKYIQPGCILLLCIFNLYLAISIIIIKMTLPLQLATLPQVNTEIRKEEGSQKNKQDGALAGFLDSGIKRNKIKIHICI